MISDKHDFIAVLFACTGPAQCWTWHSSVIDRAKVYGPLLFTAERPTGGFQRMGDYCLLSLCIGKPTSFQRILPNFTIHKSKQKDMNMRKELTGLEGCDGYE